MNSTSQQIMRLQRFLARAGVASRRHAEKIIMAGRVTVNGEVATLGSSVDPAHDDVCIDGGTPLSLVAKQTTLMLHKPAGFVTTMDDPQGRQTVAALLPLERFPSIFPVGRLDRDTTGLLLFTTDGELGHALLHPRRHVEKRYVACVEGVPAEEVLSALREGVLLSDGITLPAQVRLLTGCEQAAAKQAIGEGARASGIAQGHSGKRSFNRRMQESSYVEVCLHEGRKRQVRRMFEAVGHPVISLHRTMFASLELGELARGEFRELTEDEVGMLKKEAAGNHAGSSGTANGGAAGNHAGCSGQP